jgi:hypothetical protein
MIPEVKLSTEQAKKLEEYLEWHMSNCFESIHVDESELPEGWQPFDAYCGCFTCESREWLMATFAFLKENGLVDVYVEDPRFDDENTLF